MPDTVLLPHMYLPRPGQRFDYPMACAFQDRYLIEIERECRWAEDVISSNPYYTLGETTILTPRDHLTYRHGWPDTADWCLLAIVDYSNGYTTHCGAYLRINWLTHELYWADRYGALPFDERMPVGDHAFWQEQRERQRRLWELR